MIQKLRRKFILISVLLSGLVLLCVVIALIATSYQRLSRQADAAMRMALGWSESSSFSSIELDPHLFSQWKDEEAAALLPVFSVTIRDNRLAEVYISNSVTVSNSTLSSAADAALARNASSGLLTSCGLLYQKETRPDGVHIAFLSFSWMTSNLWGQISSGLLISALALLALFLVGRHLARWALAPVETAWQQQRQFIADASHELRTPITVILTNTNILLSHRDSTVGEQEKWVEYIQEESQGMKLLVEDLLFLAKNDSTRQVPLVPLSLSELAEGCCLLFESVAFEKGVTLTSRIAPSLTVEGNDDQLRRLTSILLDNACKYTPAGGTVTALLEAKSDAAVLSVRNTGDPIPPEHLPHLFERFYRTDSGRARSEGGYGLGLAIAKSIADAHRGKISVTSSREAGTVFTVSIPLAKPGAGTQAKESNVQ